MKSCYVLLCSLMLFGCIPNNPADNPLEGKIKTLEMIYPDASDTMEFHYNYNSTGYLTAMESDSLKFFISEKTGNEILITVTEISSDPMFGGSRKFKVYTNVNNSISVVCELDTVTMEESEHFRVSYESGEVDTFTIKGHSVFASNIQTFKFQFDNNYIKHKGSWHINAGFYGFDCNDTTVYTYATYSNTGFIPLQIPVNSITTALSGHQSEEFILYLMGINDVHALKENNKLIQSISTYVYPSVLGPPEKNYLTNFNYVQNASGQVSEMHVSNPDGTGTFMIYKMTYY